MSDTDLDADLIEVVLTEALESLESALWTLRAIDHGPQSPEVVASLFRCFHSIKGNTAMAGRIRVSQASHRVESALDVARSRHRALAPSETKALVEVVDLLHPLIDGEDSETVWQALEVSLTRLEGLFTNDVVPQPQPTRAPSADTEPDSAPQSVEHPNQDAGPLGPDNGEKHQDPNHSKLKVDVQSILDAMTVAGELFQVDERLKFFVRAASAHLSQEELEKWDGLTQISREFDASIERLYEQLLDIQRLPVSQLAGPLERNVRDICRKTGKRIDLVVVGRDLRIDKNVIQTLKDPLMHMVRNASDHGAEPPLERRAAGKPESARVTLQFEDAEDQVVVTLADDGRGMDPQRISKKAVEQGLVDANDVAGLSLAQIFQFIFHPGFSTAAQVSELSGRGVGMDVVAKALSEAGGVIETHSELGKGTRFRIAMPKLGSPVVDGLAVRSGPSVYLIPLKSVLGFVARSEFSVVTEPLGRVSALYNDRVYPLSFLPGQPDVVRLNNDRCIGALVEDRRGRRGMIVVDEVLGRRRALSQQVPYHACHLERKSSVAILGDGTMGFTVSVEDLLSEKLLLTTQLRLPLRLLEAENDLESCAS